MTAHLAIDEGGTLRTDLFYILETSAYFGDRLFRDLQWFRACDGVILRDRKRRPGVGRDGWARVENLSQGKQEFFECPVDNKHVTRNVWTECVADFLGGEHVSQFVPDEFGDLYFMISEALAAAIRKQPLRGVDLRPIKFNVNQSDQPEPELFAWQFTGKNCCRILFVAGGKNQCPFCGNAPVICPGCGDWPNQPCKKCKKMTLCPQEDLHADPKLIRFDAERPDLQIILEGSKWDGADCIRNHGRQLASKRVVDWLVKREASPLVAVPVRFCTDGMSDQQKKWLEEAISPV
jgi:hypothetical protein